ncbi:fimbria/pilus chaperone family protein [Enterobacter quasiroggenkampii]|uniref:fimbria/pilus chaperone family protein n=1 Tax=Enterobacter quasiroggenkampii TaxID=2497436 RepID=UPI0021D044D6|nr:fimbria/pilus chaperone family protein [Enterobacter quasiroggenkampii]MCU6359043.1 fimbria/pilus periplasmic chaperone [Enterobacter quasiroggenkampii]
MFKCPSVSVFLFFLLYCISLAARASGMLPDTSVVVLEENTRETTIVVTNTDKVPALLLTSVQSVPEDKEKIIQVSPPAIRVDAGKKQTVRFLLTSQAPLKTERLKRVIFEGVPPKDNGDNRVKISVTQNLPVVIRPAGLVRNNTPWKLLKWTYHNKMLTVSNPSPYVVRLAQAVQTLPDNTRWNLNRTYILPSETVSLKLESQKAPSSPEQVHISPATTWGFTVDSWDAPLEP